jgi:hypothetical protein
MEADKLRIIEQDIFCVPVICGLIKGRLDTVGQQKQLQHAPDFRGRRAAEDGNPLLQEVRLRQQFLPKLRPLSQDIDSSNRESEFPKNLVLHVHSLRSQPFSQANPV